MDRNIIEIERHSDVLLKFSEICTLINFNDAEKTRIRGSKGIPRRKT